jgi:hypothetical protein
LVIGLPQSMLQEEGKGEEKSYVLVYSQTIYNIIIIYFIDREIIAFSFLFQQL